MLLIITPNNTMKKPTSQISEVLFELIRKRKVSILNFGHYPGFRTRVSELVNKHKLPLKDTRVTEVNKYGNNYTYTVHHLPESSREKAVKLYLKLIA